MPSPLRFIPVGTQIAQAKKLVGAKYSICVPITHTMDTPAGLFQFSDGDGQIDEAFNGGSFHYVPGSSDRQRSQALQQVCAPASRLSEEGWHEFLSPAK